MQQLTYQQEMEWRKRVFQLHLAAANAYAVAEAEERKFRVYILEKLTNAGETWKESQ